MIRSSLMYVRALVGPRPVYSRISCTTAPEIAEAIDPFGAIGMSWQGGSPFAPPSSRSGRAKERKETDWNPSARPVYPHRVASICDPLRTHVTSSLVDRNQPPELSPDDLAVAHVIDAPVTGQRVDHAESVPDPRDQGPARVDRWARTRVGHGDSQPENPARRSRRRMASRHAAPRCSPTRSRTSAASLSERVLEAPPSQRGHGKAARAPGRILTGGELARQLY